VLVELNTIKIKFEGQGHRSKFIMGDKWC